METATTSTELPLQLEKELQGRIDKLLAESSYMNNLVETMATYGHDKWLHLGASEATVKATSNETIKTTAEGILQNGWQAFSKSLTDSIEGGGTVPVFCADFKDAELPVGTVMTITNAMFNRLPASESYKFVGDQYETQFILRQYLNIAHGKGSDALDDAAVTGGVDDVLLIGDWTWASASANFVSAQYYRDLYNK